MPRSRDLSSLSDAELEAERKRRQRRRVVRVYEMDEDTYARHHAARHDDDDDEGEGDDDDEEPHRGTPRARKSAADKSTGARFFGAGAG